jgi:hypothetical protein
MVPGKMHIQIDIGTRKRLLYSHGSSFREEEMQKNFLYARRKKSRDASFRTNPPLLSPYLQ